MEERKGASFGIDRAMSRLSKPSVFDRIVKEVEATEIPAKYIEQILIQFHDGNIVELKGEDITLPIPLNKDACWEDMEESFKKMRDVRVFLNTETLEVDINLLVEQALGKYC